MLSSRALCCFPSVKKQKDDFHSFSVQCTIKQLLDSVFVISQFCSQSFVPLDQQLEKDCSGSDHFEITTEILLTKFCRTDSLRSLHLCGMPEMVAPRALVFQPLVKGNEALGTRLVISRRIKVSVRVISLDFWVENFCLGLDYSGNPIIIYICCRGCYTPCPCFLLYLS